MNTHAHLDRILQGGGERPCLLLAEGNADMRQHLCSLLNDRYDVIATAHGKEALESIESRLPELVLSNVMMPLLDGFALLKALRADERTCSIPIILLSAHAGEAANAERLEAGADDYLVTPFTAAELQARVESNLRIHRLRRALISAEAQNRSQAERCAALMRANQDLVSAKDELEQFANIAAHDLREPLRMVSQFMDILGRELDQGLTERQRRYLGFAVEGAQRMYNLVRDLLDFTVVGRHEEVSGPVDLNAVVAEAVQNLHIAITEKKAEVRVAPLPAAWGERTKLLGVFQNLIENALKFHGEAPPRVEITAETAGDDIRIHVKDNGIGIAPQFHQHIFGVFRRLHLRNQYPGTGMGLALCRKIVDQLGGEISLVSREGEGSDFIVRLPAAAAAPRKAKGELVN